MLLKFVGYKRTISLSPETIQYKNFELKYLDCLMKIDKTRTLTIFRKFDKL